MATQTADTPTGPLSILDTDLYKLTMQCAVHKYFPTVPVTYHLTNRTPNMRLSTSAFSWLQSQVASLANVTLSDAEFAYLDEKAGYLKHGDYLEFLRAFRFKPEEQVSMSFDTTKAEPGFGDLVLDVKGTWEEAILYEIPLLALVSEAYFRFVDRDWSYEGQVQMAYEKGVQLIKGGCIFSEFGTRRRRDYKAQDLVMEGLKKAHDELTADPEAKEKKWGMLSGTSNVHFAMKHGVSPVGTVAHEWFMGIAASTQDYKGATAKALEYWINCFGRGVLGIALTDTFGTPVFLDAFRQPLPSHLQGLTQGWLRKQATYADVFAGTRQDSGDPKKFIKLMRRFYDEQEIAHRGTIVFSDSLNVEKAITYKKLAEKKGFSPSFGIGTFLTNDFLHKSSGEKSKPLNIVIKISSAGGNPAIKLSDDLGKNTGDDETVKFVKKELGYVDQHWDGANEQDRYDEKTIGDDMSDSE